MKSLHGSNEIHLIWLQSPSTYQTVSTTTSAGSGSGTANDVLYIKHSVAIANLNRLETQSTNPDIAELCLI